MIFNWLRNNVCNAVLAGVSDAVERLGSDDQGDNEQAAKGLRLMLTLDANGDQDADKSKGRAKKTA